MTLHGHSNCSVGLRYLHLHAKSQSHGVLSGAIEELKVPFCDSIESIHRLCVVVNVLLVVGLRLVVLPHHGYLHLAEGLEFNVGTTQKLNDHGIIVQLFALGDHHGERFLRHNQRSNAIGDET